jgi:hypothetical protein
MKISINMREAVRRKVGWKAVGALRRYPCFTCPWRITEMGENWAKIGCFSGFDTMPDV